MIFMIILGAGKKLGEKHIALVFDFFPDNMVGKTSMEPSAKKGTLHNATCQEIAGLIRELSTTTIP